MPKVGGFSGAVTPSVVAVLVAPLCAAEPPTAKPREVGMSEEGLAKIAPVIRKFIDDKKLAGAVTIVARRGKTGKSGYQSDLPDPFYLSLLRLTPPTLRSLPADRRISR